VRIQDALHLGSGNTNPPKPLMSYLKICPLSGGEIDCPSHYTYNKTRREMEVQCAIADRSSQIINRKNLSSSPDPSSIIAAAQSQDSSWRVFRDYDFFRRHGRPLQILV